MKQCRFLVAALCINLGVLFGLSSLGASRFSDSVARAEEEKRSALTGRKSSFS